MRQHRQAVEADWRRFYHCSLAEALAEWQMAEVWACLRFLPPDAALWRKLEAEEPSTKIEDDDAPTYATKGEEVRAFFTEHFGQSSAR